MGTGRAGGSISFMFSTMLQSKPMHDSGRSRRFSIQVQSATSTIVASIRAGIAWRSEAAMDRSPLS